VEGISTLSGLGVDLGNMFVMRGCNGDIRPFWGCNVEKMDQRGNLIVKVMNTSA